jgi:hypothetical protein
LDGRAGLTGIPAAFKAIRGDLGLLRPDWDILGDDWQEFVRKWLTAEKVLGRAGGNIMEVDELQSSDLPAALKAWGTAQITKVEFEAEILTVEFGNEMRRWWDELGLKKDWDGHRLLNFAWCRNGKVGIAMLVVGMHWWADRSGAGNDWTRVLKEMSEMWQLIVETPLQ